jgi:hypothetical protein
VDEMTSGQRGLSPPAMNRAANAPRAHALEPEYTGFSLC